MGEVIDFTEAPPVGGKTVLLFWAPWHEASAAGGPMDQVLRALASSTSETVHFGRIQAEELPDVSDRYGVSVVPTFILLNEAGVVVERIDGGDDVSQVTQAVQRLVAASPSQGGGTGGDLVSLSPTEMLTQRLERLIRSSEVMLFMKGVPTAPRCGFSRQVVDMLQEENIPFGSFDILSDENVRQGLKTHSNWPTYPQIYAKGDLIGGLDILKEMKEEGSLKEQFGITATAEAQPSLEERLKKLINRNRVMLFMKGLPSAPRCGFSRQTVEILDSESVPYDTFDILQDEEVRQGLKSYSNWPTFPQLYVDGDLVGGLDIIQEMEEDGSLSELLKGAHGQ